MIEPSSPAVLAIGPVEVRVPADPALARVLRLAASGLASMSAFSVDEIEDVKLAVSEIVIVLIEHGAGEDLVLRFEVTGSEFVVTGSTAVSTFDQDHRDLALTRSVLDSVCAEHEITFDVDEVRITATVRHLDLA